MKVITFNNNEMGQNIYMYYDDISETKREGVIIDAGCSKADVGAITKVIEKECLKRT
jgi:hypothetical protein